MKSVLADRLFHLKENGTTVRRECFAGLTTFVTMAYILAVNPAILGAAGMDRGAVFTASALAACAATLLMALLSNYPFALAPGMGAERLLRLHRGHQTGLLLADGPGCGLPGGPALHCPLRHFGAGGHLQLHPPASKAGRHLGHRPVHPLHRPSELQADRGRPLHHAVGLPLPGGHRLRGDALRGPGGGAGLRRNPPHRHPHHPQGEGRPAAGHPGRVGGGHPLSAHRPLCPQRRAGHGQRPARLLRRSGRPQPGPPPLCRWTSPGCSPSIF